MKTKCLIFGSLVVLLAVVGCATLERSDAQALQGTWIGPEVDRDKGNCALVISGQKLEFRGADSREWYKGTFTLREDTAPKQLIGVVTECPVQQYVGKTVHAIYQLDGKTLRLCGNEPGTPAAPAAFAAPGSRSFLLTRQSE